MKTISVLLLSSVAVLVFLACATRLGVIAIEHAYPPEGRLIEVQGAALHVLDLGPRDRDEPAIVLIHGASANLESVRQPLADVLAQRHRVIMVDRPGHGWSWRASLRDSTPAIQARMIDEALGKLGVDRAIMVGHSWGGAVLPELALQHPNRIAGLVMLAPVTHPWNTGIVWYHRLAATPLIGPLFAYTLELPIALSILKVGARGVFMPQTMPAGYITDTALPLLVRPREFLANGRDMVTLEASVAASQPRYHEITVPTIVIHGDADHVVSIDIHARSFVSEVKTARLIELPGIGHMVQNAAPQVVIGAIEQLMPARESLAAE